MILPVEGKRQIALGPFAQLACEVASAMEDEGSFDNRFDSRDISAIDW